MAQMKQSRSKKEAGCQTAVRRPRDTGGRIATGLVGASFWPGTSRGRAHGFLTSIAGLGL